jgi:ferrous iron transport protein B
MSCTAKLPIYAFFSGCLLPGTGGLGHAVALYLPRHHDGHPVDLPFERRQSVPWRGGTPSSWNCRTIGCQVHEESTWMLMWEKAKDFLQRAFTVIFVATIIIWFLQHFDLQSLNMVDDSSSSMLAGPPAAISPIFAPIGLGTGASRYCIDHRLHGKGIVVSTLYLCCSAAPGALQTLTSSAAFSLLVFCLLYTPCIAAVSAIKRELVGNGHSSLYYLPVCACLGMRSIPCTLNWYTDRTGINHGNNEKRKRIG